MGSAGGVGSGRGVVAFERSSSKQLLSHTESKQQYQLWAPRFGGF